MVSSSCTFSIDNLCFYGMHYAQLIGELVMLRGSLRLTTTPWKNMQIVTRSYFHIYLSFLLTSTQKNTNIVVQSSHFYNSVLAKRPPQKSYLKKKRVILPFFFIRINLKPPQLWLMYGVLSNQSC